MQREVRDYQVVISMRRYLELTTKETRYDDFVETANHPISDVVDIAMETLNINSKKEEEA